MPPLPALQIRVPNPANALLQAEQILGARAQRNALAQQTRQQGQIAQQFAGGIPQDRAGQQALAGRIAAIDPQQALQFQQSFNALGAQDRARVQQEGQQVSRALFGVTNQAQYDQARSTLPPAIANGLPAEFQPQVVRSLVQASRSIDSMFAEQAQQGFTLSPGQTRFDAAGQPVASAPAAGPSLTQRERDIAALMARGFPRNDAEDIAAGRVRVATDPVTGETQLVNVATAATRPLGGTEPSTTLTATERGRLFNQNASIERVLGLSEGLEESAASATGPRGSLGALANSLFGLLGRDAPIPADEIAAARQDIRLFNQIAKTAIVNNPRFPVAEQEIVQQMLPSPSTFFANPSVEFNKVLQLQEFLRALQSENRTSLGEAPTGDLTAEEQAELDRLRASQR